MKEIVVAVTGASGALYAGRLLRALLIGGHGVHLVLSKYGRYLLREELGFRPDQETLTEFLIRLYGEEITAGTLREYSVADQSSAIASGSFDTDGMVIVPCSIKTLSGIAHGHAENLIERAADVVLKERRRLIMVVRETPLNLIHLRNMTAVTEAGAVVLPAMPAFYQQPQTFDDLGDFIAGRICSLLGIQHALFPRWTGSKASTER
ncbi:MAG: flavin prenyltransferase UbiX [Candidatus Latescibacterota bacterium]|nr:flavin prenyltransferase UbiX [Candidatus Latescibacterota bacterium]MEE2627733.1 flavin prenyltransferase UbiX [Candidatus Latescibacterota bacterium]MEE2728449.1 flavin prenyltransferase UbiX [Candidatus Latescibacterota bacterium]